MTRPRREIMRDLHAILAELNYALEMEDKPGTDDLSPKLAQALGTANRATTPDQAGQRALGSKLEDIGRSVPRETHADIRAKARAYKEPGIPLDDKPERLKDYTPAVDPNWDEAVFLGTGDQREP